MLMDNTLGIHVYSSEASAAPPPPPQMDPQNRGCLECVCTVAISVHMWQTGVLAYMRLVGHGPADT